MLSNEGPWDVVSLDHDLDYEEFVPSLLPNTGMEVVRWLCENNEFISRTHRRLKIVIHTSNKAAGFQMAERLRNANFNSVTYIRFTYDD